MDLFERSIEVSAKENEGGIVVDGRLSDTYHEMTLTAEFTFPDLVITRAEGKMVRYPHPECLLGVETLKKVVGVKAGREFFRKLEAAYGGPVGCAHFLNLVYQAGLAAVQARFAMSKTYAPEEIDRMPKPQRIRLYLKLQPGMRNSCAAWATENPMVAAADAISD